MKPLIITFALTIAVPGSEPKRFEVPVKGDQAIAICADMVAKSLVKPAKKAEDGRTVTAEYRAVR